MEGAIHNRMLALVAMMVLVLVTSTHFAAADYNMAGRKFTITNIPPLNSDPYCPGSTTNTVSFFPSLDNPLQGTALIVGGFEGADIGVCSNGSVYAAPPGTTFTYSIYANLIIFQISIANRGPFVSELSYENGNLYAVGQDQFKYVSQLTDCGPAS